MRSAPYIANGFVQLMGSIRSRVPWRSGRYHCKNIQQRRDYGFGCVSIASAPVAHRTHRLQCSRNCGIHTRTPAHALYTGHDLQRGRQYFSHGSCGPPVVRGAVGIAMVSRGAIPHHWHNSHLSGSAAGAVTATVLPDPTNRPYRRTKTPSGLISHSDTALYSSRNQSRASCAKASSAASDAPPIQDDGEPPLNFKAVLTYDGTDFNGWQYQALQPDCVTVQGRFERALSTITLQPRQALKVQAAGRTDSGVHAVGQVVSFRLPDSCRMTEEALLKGVNARCPLSLRVLEVARVPPDFSARHTAIGKLYRYSVCTTAVADPFTRHVTEHVPWALDMSAVRQVASLFEGTHNFRQFANLSPSNEWRDPIKTLTRFDVIDTPTGFSFEIEGNGFLYKMVRHMVGAALTVGSRRLPIERVSAALLKGSEELPGEKYRGWNIASPRGLCLMRVDYPPHHDLSLLMHPDRKTSEAVIQSQACV